MLEFKILKRDKYSLNTIEMYREFIVSFFYLLSDKMLYS